jgi:uncharacterized small protein (DUF1192 family)
MPNDFSADEHRLLVEILHDELGRLKAEINRTETTSFREELKQREALLVGIIGRLERPQA